MNEQTAASQWAENVIIADAGFAGRVAFDLTVNFERTLERRVAPASLSRWLECVALDGGVPAGDGSVTAVLIDDSGRSQMECFTPSDYASAIDGKAFRGCVGEVSLYRLPYTEPSTGDELLPAMVRSALADSRVRRLMIVADDRQMYARIAAELRQAPDDKRVTMFAMQPMSGGNFRQEILGYSLMSALGITSAEIDAKLRGRQTTD